MDLSCRHCLVQHNLKAVQTHSKVPRLHPTVMWYQVITTQHLHRNSTHSNLSKLTIEPLSNSPMNGLSASMKQTAHISFLFFCFLLNTHCSQWRGFPQHISFEGYKNKQNKQTTHLKDRKRFHWHHIWRHKDSIEAHG